MKKLLSVLTIIAMLFAIAVPLISYADVRTNEGQADLLQEDVFKAEVFAPTTYDLSNNSLNNLKNLIKTSLLNCSSRITVSTYGLTNVQFETIYSNVINDNPELFYVSSSYTYNYNKSTGVINHILPEYVMTKAEINQAKIIYEAGVEKALSQVDDSMNDVQKALVIHDYIANKATYPYISADNSNDMPSYHSAYGFYLDGYTVCAGYALTFSDLMHRLGIESKYVVSESMGHAWNVIKIGDNWYNIDLTFDEIQFVSGTNNKGTVLHNSFMKSDEGIQSLEGVGHYDISYPEGVECNDTSYDNYFWHGVNTNIIVKNGYYYYINYDNSAKTVDLIKRDANGIETKLNSNTYKSYCVSSSSNTNKGTLSYLIPFSKLVCDDNILYFSYVDNGAKIGAYNIDNNIEYKSVLSHDSYNFGLDVNEGIISYSTYADRYNYIDFKQIDAFNNSYPSYNIYADENKDGYINAKDYKYILDKEKDTN